MEIKRCARCGMFLGGTGDVCSLCQTKDEKDLGKLKNFLEGYNQEEYTKQDLSINTGITMKNLNRFLGKEDLK